MPIGHKLTIKFHEDAAGTPVFDSAALVEFNHAAGFAGATAVMKEDFTGNPDDAFIVQVTYPSSTAVATLTAFTVDAMMITARDAVNNLFGDGEAGAPTA